MKTMNWMRLNKFLAESGVASRRNSEEFILQGRVSLNGMIVSSLSQKINPEKDIVELDGEKIKPRKHVYYLLNKPAGFVTTTKDDRKRRTVLDLIKTDERIFPVGRLDYNTTGLLLLTNDGNFANLLTHPRHNIPRTYEVTLDNALNKNNLDRLLKGIYIDKRKGRFIKIEFPKSSNKKLVRVTTVEGRNHFVKNMFNALGYKVLSLNRLSFAGFKIDVPVGKYRKISTSEIENAIQEYL